MGKKEKKNLSELSDLYLKVIAVKREESWRRFEMRF
jgi:hypothetical protein